MAEPEKQMLTAKELADKAGIKPTHLRRLLRKEFAVLVKPLYRVNELSIALIQMTLL